MRDFQETLEWYRTHTTTQEIGFNPDSMCLKVCRTARDIGPMFGTARQAQDGTPERYRITDVSEIRRGMVGYFADPHDSNPYDHIVTFIGRVKDYDPYDLNDILTVTNSDKKGQLTIRRASFYESAWGDDFQFASNWLNGQVLDVPGDFVSRVTRFRESGPNYNVKLLDAAVKSGKRFDLTRHIDRIDDAVANLPDDKRAKRVVEFKETYRRRRVLKMGLLNEAVEHGDRSGKARDARNKLRRVLKALPPS